MSLSSFFKQNALQVENVKYVASERFIDENKQPIEWEIRAITSQEDGELRKRATTRVEIPKKKGQYMTETDTEKYIGLLAAACTVYPNLNDAELQNSYGAMGADDLLKKMLIAGEYPAYLNKVQEVCGYDKTQQDLVDEAKN